MYLPAMFSDASEAVTRALVRSYPFATIAALRGADIEITHAPLLLDEREDEPLRLRGHLARGNPFVAAICEGALATAVFTGPEAYVSASWYAAPAANVPTWNYAVVHVRGRLRVVDDATLARDLESTARRFEVDEPRPWSTAMLDATFFANLRAGVVGFVLEAESVQTKTKLSQNRSPDDRGRVEEGLRRSDRPRDREVAELMAQTRAKAEP